MASSPLHLLRLPSFPPNPLSLSLPSLHARSLHLPLPFPRRPPLIGRVTVASPWAAAELARGTVILRSGYNVQIVVSEDEPEEALLRRFRREVSRAGVIQECKRRRFFENKQEERKRKAREAGRRGRRRRSGPRFFSSFSSSQSDAAASNKSADDIDDNWDMPDGDLPY